MVLPERHQRETHLLSQSYQGPALILTQRFLHSHLLPSNRVSVLTNLIFNRKFYHYLSGPLANPNWSTGNKWQSWIKTTWTVPVCQQGCFQIVTGVHASAAAHTEAGASMWHEGNRASLQKIVPMAGFQPPVHSSLSLARA